MLSLHFEIFEFKLMDKANNHMVDKQPFVACFYSKRPHSDYSQEQHECHTKHHRATASLNHLNTQWRQEQLICWSSPADQGEM